MVLIIILVLALSVGIALKWRGDVKIHDFDAQRTLPLRGVAALAVVVHHVALNTPKAPVINQFLVMGTLAVSFFFFLSGYGLMISYIKKGEKYLSGFLRHRYARLLPPFLIAAIGYEIFKSTQEGHSTLSSFTAIAHGGTILPDSWFVLVIIVYYLFFYVVAKLLRSKVGIVVGLWVVSAIYIALIYSFGWDDYWYKTVCTFNLGTTYALIENKIKGFFAVHPISLTYTALVIALMIVGCLLLPVMLPICFLLPVFVVLAVYAMGVYRSRVLVFVGTISYEIYIMQCIWRHTMYVTAHIHWSIYLIATLVMTIATAWMINKLCNKFFYKTS